MKEKREQRFVQVSVVKLNRVNQRLKPRKLKETMLRADSYVYICKSAMGGLITDCITSGVKLTGEQ